ncbi:MAG: carboxymuconolactone decarboxylase family protein [Methanomicrobiales archaeon]|jgi:AhpD family alkylhydroperoxidase|nr:carboxymuconolactone decarboxylase family protein [Methanomicrobiales archaeon]
MYKSTCSDVVNEVDELEAKIGKVPLIFRELAKQDPEMFKLVLKMDHFIWDDGAIDKKTKKLIAIAIAAALRDQHAVRAQIAGAANLGVSSEEIDEALRVTYLLAGMPAYVSGKVAQNDIMK